METDVKLRNADQMGSLDLEECPVFYPSEEEFEDPLQFIRKIRPRAERYGLCKIVPPKNWKPPFAVDKSTFQFKTKIQALHKLQERQAGCDPDTFRLEYVQFMNKRGHHITSWPAFGGKEVDLCKLFNAVKRKGGFEQVTADKKWGEVLRVVCPELNPSANPAIANGLAQLYRKHLLSYERSVCNKSSSSTLKRGSHTGGGSSSRKEELEEKAVKEPGSARDASKRKQGADSTSLLGEAKSIVQRREEIDQICEGCKGGGHEDKMLLCDRCDIGWHLYCLSPPLQSIPQGNWYCPTCVSSDEESFGFGTGDEYTIPGFQKLDEKFRLDWFGPAACAKGFTSGQLEDEFWRIVEGRTQPVEVLYGNDLDTTIYGSGFPRKSDPCPPGVDEASWTKYANSPWNLNNIATSDSSVLRFIHDSIPGVIVPWIYFGMTFSSFCWHFEDHCLYSVNYVHWGEPKLWYGVPGFAAEQFEKAMMAAFPDLFEAQPDLLFQLVTMMSPRVLKSCNVPVYRTVQAAGEFVITFPRSYHGGFNQGFNCAEAVNFAPADWLPWGGLGVERYRLFRRRSILSHEELLTVAVMNRAYEADPDMRQWLLKEFSRVVEKEREERSRFWQRGGCRSSRIAMHGKAKVISEEEDPECVICRYYLYFSAVICNCRPGDAACISHAQHLCDCPTSQQRLLYRFSMAELDDLLAAYSAAPCKRIPAAAVALPCRASAAAETTAAAAAGTGKAAAAEAAPAFGDADVKAVGAAVTTAAAMAAIPSLSPNLAEVKASADGSIGQEVNVSGNRYQSLMQAAVATTTSPSGSAQEALKQALHSSSSATESAGPAQQLCPTPHATPATPTVKAEPIARPEPSSSEATPAPYSILQAIRSRQQRKASSSSGQKQQEAVAVGGKIVHRRKVRGKEVSHAESAAGWVAKVKEALTSAPTVEYAEKLLKEAEEFLFAGHEMDEVRGIARSMHAAKQWADDAAACCGAAPLPPPHAAIILSTASAVIQPDSSGPYGHARPVPRQQRQVTLVTAVDAAELQEIVPCLSSAADISRATTSECAGGQEAGDKSTGSQQQDEQQQQDQQLQQKRVPLAKLESLLQVNPVPCIEPHGKNLKAIFEKASNLQERIVAAFKSVPPPEMRVLHALNIEASRGSIEVPAARQLREQIQKAQSWADAVRKVIPTSKAVRRQKQTDLPQISYLRQLQQQGVSLLVHMAEHSLLNSALERAAKWQQAAADLLQGMPSLEEIKSLLLESDSVPAILPEVEALRQRQDEVLDFLQRANDLLTPGSVIVASSGMDAVAEQSREEQLRSLLAEGREIRVKSLDLDFVLNELRRVAWTEAATKALIGKSSLTHLERLLEEAEGACVESPLLARLRHTVLAAKDWEARAAAALSSRSTFAELSSLVRALDSMHADVSGAAEVKAAFVSAKNLVERATAVLRMKPSRHGRSSKRVTMQELESLVEDAKKLPVSIPEAQSLVDRLAAAVEMQRRSGLLLAELKGESVVAAAAATAATSAAAAAAGEAGEGAGLAAVTATPAAADEFSRQLSLDSGFNWDSCLAPPSSRCSPMPWRQQEQKRGNPESSGQPAAGPGRWRLDAAKIGLGLGKVDALLDEAAGLGVQMAELDELERQKGRLEWLRELEKLSGAAPDLADLEGLVAIAKQKGVAESCPLLRSIKSEVQSAKRWLQHADLLLDSGRHCLLRVATRGELQQLMNTGQEVASLVQTERKLLCSILSRHSKWLEEVNPLLSDSRPSTSYATLQRLQDEIVRLQVKCPEKDRLERMVRYTAAWMKRSAAAIVKEERGGGGGRGGGGATAAARDRHKGREREEGSSALVATVAALTQGLLRIQESLCTALRQTHATDVFFPEVAVGCSAEKAAGVEENEQKPSAASGRREAEVVRQQRQQRQQLHKSKAAMVSREEQGEARAAPESAVPVAGGVTMTSGAVTMTSAAAEANRVCGWSRVICACQRPDAADEQRTAAPLLSSLSPSASSASSFFNPEHYGEQGSRRQWQCSQCLDWMHESCVPSSVSNQQHSTTKSPTLGESLAPAAMSSPSSRCSPPATVSTAALVCPFCLAVTSGRWSLPPQVLQKVHSTRRPSLVQLRELLDDSASLPCRTDEMLLLAAVVDLASQWQQHLSRLIQPALELPRGNPPLARPLLVAAAKAACAVEVHAGEWALMTSAVSSHAWRVRACRLLLRGSGSRPSLAALEEALETATVGPRDAVLVELNARRQAAATWEQAADEVLKSRTRVDMAQVNSLLRESEMLPVVCDAKIEQLERFKIQEAEWSFLACPKRPRVSRGRSSGPQRLPAGSTPLAGQNKCDIKMQSASESDEEGRLVKAIRYGAIGSPAGIKEKLHHLRRSRSSRKRPNPMVELCRFDLHADAAKEHGASQLLADLPLPAGLQDEEFCAGEGRGGIKRQMEQGSVEDVGEDDEAQEGLSGRLQTPLRRRSVPTKLRTDRQLGDCPTRSGLGGKEHSAEIPLPFLFHIVKRRRSERSVESPERLVPVNEVAAPSSRNKEKVVISTTVKQTEDRVVAQTKSNLGRSQGCRGEVRRPMRQSAGQHSGFSGFFLLPRS